MNYDRIKNIFIDLYTELSETFDNFESDFAEAVNKPMPQKPNIVIIRDTHDEIVEYFEKITQSREVVESFIKEKLAPAVKARQKFDVSSSYHYIVAKETRNSNIEVGRASQANYAAFKRKLRVEFKISQTDIHDLIRSTY
jgi:hypothetical protein